MKLIPAAMTRWSRNSGQSLPMFVFFIVVLILFVGLGIDLGFAYITKANLSKAVDAACLEGMNNINQGTATASAIASSVFAANYGRPGRDTGTVTPNISLTTDAFNNRVIGVSASAQINTFFIRVLPNWKTLSVSADAQATQRKLIMSLVLDRSGSMASDGGSTYMPGAVTNFVNNFDDANDWVSMNSFSHWARTDVTIRHSFKAPITTAVKALTYASFTGAEPGLAKGLAQNQSVPVVAGDDVVKVIVFFTDGMANTFTYAFKCGAVTTNENIDYNKNLYDPSTGNNAPNTCTVPNSITSINGGSVNTGNCVAMHDEAEARAIAIADQARALGTVVYAVGLGNAGASGECGEAVPVLNPDFLQRVANDPNYPANYDATKQPSGLAFITYNAAQLDFLFQKIAADVRLRLTQ